MGQPTSLHTLKNFEERKKFGDFYINKAWHCDASTPTRIYLHQADENECPPRLRSQSQSKQEEDLRPGADEWLTEVNRNHHRSMSSRCA